VAISLTKQQK